MCVGTDGSRNRLAWTAQHGAGMRKPSIFNA